MFLLFVVALAGRSDVDQDGYEAGVDCNDADPAVNPGATEIWYDGVDQDCNGKSDYDRDVDHYDDAGATLGRAPCPTTPGGDVDWALVDPVVGCGAGLDCDDSPQGAAYFPGAQEACELGNQVDNDCDGSVNAWRACESDRAVVGYSADAATVCGPRTYFVDRADPRAYAPSDLSNPTVLAQALARYEDFAWDPTWQPPLNASAQRYYRDGDADDAGNGRRQGVRLCDANADDVEAWRTDASDCDDADPEVNPSAVERCNAEDDNCNDVVDEPMVELTPDVDPACVWHAPDIDRDGFGDHAGLAALCVCDGFEAYEIDGGFQVVPVDPPEVCLDAEGAYGHEIGGTCYVQASGDCDDAWSRAYAGAVEVFDGHDDDCDGLLPVVELDCDGDGAPAIPHAASQALLTERLDTPIDAASLGLADCGGLSAPAFSCGGEELTLTCVPALGLWAVDVAAVEAAGVNTVLEPGAWDCDDSCASRSTATAEVCDGVDNDCDQWLDAARDGGDRFAADVDGIPDTHADTIGSVVPAEEDGDGDGAIDCTSTNAPQTSTIAATCEELTIAEGGDDADLTPDDDEVVGCACDGSGRASWSLAGLLALVGLRRRRG